MHASNRERHSARIMELMVGKEFTVQYKKRRQSSAHIVHAPHGAEPKCLRQRVYAQKRVLGRKRVHGTIEKEQAELATHSACVTWGGAKVHASWSSQ